MQFSKVPATTWQTIQINAGMLVDEFTPSSGVIGNILGATNGGIKFNPNPTYDDFGSDVDNVPPNTWQLKRVKSYDPSLSSRFATMTAALAAVLSGAGAFATGDSTHFIPGHKLTENDFDDVWFIGDYSDKNEGAANAGYVAIHIINALNTAGFQIQTQKDGKGYFDVDFHGHYDLTNPDTAPFEFYIKAGTTPA